MNRSTTHRLLERSAHPLTPPDAARPAVSTVWLWFGALGGPIAWAVHLMVMYPLVELACRRETTLPLYGASALLFAAAALAGLVSWHYVRRMRDRNGATVPRRIRFMARGGLYAAVLFMLLIGAGTLPVLFDDPCQLQGRRGVRTVLPHL